MEKKQTAVEWLIDQLRQLAHNQSTHLGMGDIRVTQGMLDDFEEQAKQMQKQQIIDAHIHGHNAPSSTVKMYDAEQYYKETFGGNNEQQ